MFVPHGHVHLQIYNYFLASSKVSWHKYGTLTEIHLDNTYNQRDSFKLFKTAS